MLKGAEDHGLAAFGGDHDKDALMTDQLAGDQLFQHLLTILAAAQVVVMQDDVVALVAAHAQGFFTAIGGVHITRTHVTQHGLKRTAKVGEIIDDQDAFTAVFQH